MPRDQVLRMTWQGALSSSWTGSWRLPKPAPTEVVHVVDIDVSKFEPRGLRDRILCNPPPQIAVTSGLMTLCGQHVPSRALLVRDTPVTCESCLDRLGAPYLEDVKQILADQRRVQAA